VVLSVEEAEVLKVVKKKEGQTVFGLVKNMEEKTKFCDKCQTRMDVLQDDDGEYFLYCTNCGDIKEIGHRSH
jgi:Fe2+ or Zn2+ uptake regulation protein